MVAVRKDWLNSCSQYSADLLESCISNEQTLV
jgi:hypothetical protein